MKLPLWPVRGGLRRPGPHVVAVVALVASLLSLAGGSDRRAEAALPYCATPSPPRTAPIWEEQEVPCLPTHAECATGRYNGRWIRKVRVDGRDRQGFVDCAGHEDPVTRERFLIHYAGGLVEAGTNGVAACGSLVENGRLVVGSWDDPNWCLRPSPTRGVAQTGTRYRPAVSGPKGVVASISPQASRAGLEMLRAGGNAVDAAVAAIFAVGVTNPETCGLGGGGFLVARMADGRVRTLDFRETAPAAMKPDSLEMHGINQWGTGHRVVGVPGTVAGMDEALRVLGTKTLAETITGPPGSTVPMAEQLAREGTEVALSTAVEYGHPLDYLLGRSPAVTAENLADEDRSVHVMSGGPTQEERLRLFPETARTYLYHGHGYFPGAIIKQPDYARSLALIAKHGRDVFYKRALPNGPPTTIAALIAAEMDRSRLVPTDGGRLDPEQTPLDPEGARGLMEASDLEAYQPVWRDPLRSSYRGYEVLAPPPPNAGGIQVQQILNILETFDLRAIGHSTDRWLHLLTEAQKLALADRDKYVADRSDVPTAVLTSQGYANQRAKQITEEAQPFEAGAIPGYEHWQSRPDESSGEHTTHVSVIDRTGNAVAVTCTLEQAFGSGVVAPGTGFLLNNQLSDFSAPGTVNEPNGGKRPRSNTAPVIVVKAGRPVLVLGGMGGPRIPMGVVHLISNVVDFGHDISTAIDLPRSFTLGQPVNVQPEPDKEPHFVKPVYVEEDRLPGEVAGKLVNDRKHHVIDLEEYAPFPIMQVASDAGTVRRAVSDSRSDFGAVVEP